MKNKALITLIIIAAAGSVGGLIAGYDMGIISGAQLFITDEWKLLPKAQGQLVSAAVLGALLGVCVNGFLADVLGRKRIIAATAIIYLIGSLMCANADSLLFLTIARLTNGIACGMANIVVPLYLSEISPQKTRGLFVSLYQLSFTLGILISYLTGYIFAESGNWRMMFMTGVIPAVFLIFAFFFISESPRWLISKGRNDEAKAIFEKTDPDTDAEALVNEITETYKETASEKVALKKWMFVPVLIGIGIMFAQICTGINTIICYAPKIFQNAGFADASSALGVSIFIGFINFIMTFVAMYLSDKAGRKPLLYSGAAIMGVGMFLLSFSFFGAEMLGDAQKWIALIAIIGFICSFAYSLGPVAWILISEIFPLKAKGVLMSIPIAANFIFNVILLFSFPIMFAKIGEGYTFGIFGVICVISLIFIYFFVPETKGISLERIEKNWRRGIPPRRFAVKK